MNDKMIRILMKEEDYEKMITLAMKITDEDVRNEMVLLFDSMDML